MIRTFFSKIQSHVGECQIHVSNLSTIYLKICAICKFLSVAENCSRFLGSN